MFTIIGMCKVLMSTHAVRLRFYRTLPRLEPSREVAISKAIGSWDFSAHEFHSEDDLVHIAFLMLQHALAMPELEKWRLPAGTVS